MGFFGQASPFDADVDKATNEKNTAELWDVIMNICDKVGSNSKNAKDCIRSIMRRLGHQDPHVVVQAITLLNACINNCGKNFHLEIASRDFETEYKKLMGKAQPPVALKMRLSLKKWSENEFKTDPELNLIPSLYQKLRADGLDFTDSSGTSAKKAAPDSPSSTAVSSQKEQDDLALAIELSLQEKANSTFSPASQAASSSTPYASLYPSMNGTATSASPAKAAEPRKVRALYDFEAAEDNELTFMSGEIIHVTDDSDPNWWKGYNQRGDGLFPSNFVTADLSVEPQNLEENKHSSAAALSAAEAEQAAKASFIEPAVIEIDEDKIDRLLHLLHEANPEDPSQDSEEMLQLEAQVYQMLPLIDTELERVDRKHAQLTQLSSDLVEAINLYHTLMREPDRGHSAFMPGGAYTMRPGSGGLPNGMYGGGMYQQPHPMSAGGGVPGLTHNMHTMSMAGAHHQMMPGGYGPMPGHLPPGAHQMPMHNGHPGGAHPGVAAMGPPQHTASTVPSAMHPQQAPHQQAPHQLQQFQPPPHQQPQNGQSNPNMIPPAGSDPNMAPPTTMHQLSQSQQQPPPQHNMIPNAQPPVSGAPLQQPMNNLHYAMGPTGYAGPSFNGQPMPMPAGQPPPHPSMYLHQQPQQQPPPQHHPHHPNQAPNNGISPNHQLHMIPNMAAITQPVTTTILPSADSRANIPIYQQQR